MAPNPAGRPPKLKPKEKRTATVGVRVNEDEKRLLERWALAWRVSEGEVLRRALVALGEPPKGDL